MSKRFIPTQNFLIESEGAFAHGMKSRDCRKMRG
jgi:hypothetical protein